jgi:hypothetical protein
MSPDRPSRLRPLPFLLASGASVALILAAPFIGEVRRAILTRFPGQFGRIIGAIVLLGVGTAIVIAVSRIRTHRAWRYAGLASALALAASYSWLTRTGDPTVDAVERFHFVEYGVVTFLFYRAWRPAGDLSALVLPVLAGLLVGTIEEWFQWFIPARVGDVWDVFLNGVAITCGLIFSLAFDPPGSMTRHLTASGRRRIGLFAALVLVVFAAFFHSVHLGYLVTGDGWRFRSGYGARTLEAIAADRAARWRGTVIERPKRLSAEDQYATEGLWHVQRRNRAWDAKDVRTAWMENLILERYFGPVLDTPSYVSKTGHRWGPEHRADAARQARELGRTDLYESDAQAGAIHIWPRTTYWAVVAFAALALVTLALRGLP